MKAEWASEAGIRSEVGIRKEGALKTLNTQINPFFNFNHLNFNKVRRRKALAASSAMFLASGLLLAGCGSKDESASPATARQGSPKTAQVNSMENSGVKPTPEQEAAKQRAIDEGPAIQAANNPPEGGK